MLKNKIEVTKDELENERIEKRKKEEEEKAKRKSKNFIICNEIDYNSLIVDKQVDICISK